MLSIENIDRRAALNLNGMLFAILIEEQASPKPSNTRFTRMHPYRIRPDGENSIRRLRPIVLAPRHRHIRGQRGTPQEREASAQHQRRKG